MLKQKQLIVIQDPGGPFDTRCGVVMTYVENDTTEVDVLFVDHPPVSFPVTKLNDGILRKKSLSQYHDLAVRYHLAAGPYRKLPIFEVVPMSDKQFDKSAKELESEVPTTAAAHTLAESLKEILEELNKAATPEETLGDALDANTDSRGTFTSPKKKSSKKKKKK